MKTFFELPSYYEGIKVRRIAHSGRLWLVSVISETNLKGEIVPPPFPYWFILIKNFNLKRDYICGAESIGVWRFAHKSEAFAKFNELKEFFPPPVPRPPSPAQLASRERFAKKQRERGEDEA